jgi:hypothetical protein
MTAENISVGPAPHFLIKTGRITVFHFASMEVTPFEGETRRITFSHLSFFNLVKEIAERSLALGFHHAENIKWAKYGQIGLVFTLPMRIIKIDYRTHSTLNVRDRDALSVYFEKILKDFLHTE